MNSLNSIVAVELVSYDYISVAVLFFFVVLKVRVSKLHSGVNGGCSNWACHC
jgi:hypothetical protein